MATSSTRLWILPPAYCQWRCIGEGPQGAHHSFVHTRIFRTFRLRIATGKGIFEKYPPSTLREAGAKKKNDQKGNQWLLLQSHPWNFQIQWSIWAFGHFGQHYLWICCPTQGRTYYFLQKCHYSSPQSSNVPSLPRTPNEMLNALLSKGPFPWTLLAWWSSQVLAFCQLAKGGHVHFWTHWSAWNLRSQQTLTLHSKGI